MELLERLRAWTLRWSGDPRAELALFGVAFAESSFFPVPPDLLLVAMGLALPSRALRYAWLATLGSVLGGMAGYGLGALFMGSVGAKLLQWGGLWEEFGRVQQWYRHYDLLAVAVAGFTPIPYKVFTLGAGACGLNPLGFALASLVGRGGRFFLEGGLLWRLGPLGQRLVERHLGAITVGVVILGVALYLLAQALR